MTDTLGRATYSPEDNKLRFYPDSRLSKDDYNRIKSAGFSWAPKQELFVAPMWTPGREDLLLEWCGEVGDEDTSLIERTEQRAERFEQYSDNRKEDADSAHKAVSAICDNIPLGQPILVGHHSEKHARKDAESIENGMRKAVKMWEQSEYWQRRAAGAIRAAKYKELPSVRARRIKKIEADFRSQQRFIDKAQASLDGWEKIAALPEEGRQEAALRFAGYSEGGHLHLKRKEGDKPDFDQCPTAYDALSNSYPNLYAPRTLDEVLTAARTAYPRSIAGAMRWICHYQNRLAYEKAMLAEDGGIATDQVKPEKGGACKCWASHRGGWSYIVKVNQVSVTVLDNWGNGGANFTRTIPFDKLSSLWTAAQVQQAKADGRLVEYSDKTGFGTLDREPVKETTKPIEPEQKANFEAMRETLKAGVKVVCAPQLFPTPPELAQRMVELAELQICHRILEPSAGTGNILKAIDIHANKGGIVAVEINQELCRHLNIEDVQNLCRDFLSCNGELGQFDRILMNPPFANGQDIAHINHALHMLKPGGRLVAICANGPRQQEQLMPLADEWIDLEPGTFKEQGTNVNTALLIINT